MRFLLPVIATALAVGGCAGPASSFPMPPPLPEEAVPLAPPSAVPLAWHPGDWIYTAGSYRFQSGEYEPLAGYRRDYVFGHWAGTAKHSIWVPGHWSP